MILCKFLVFVILKVVIGQICNETTSVLRSVPETYQYTFYEAYEGESCMVWCTKSKLAVNVGTRQVQKVINETVNVCCEGYVIDDTYTGDGIKCIPLCNPQCENGYCRNPNECACEPGYAIDPNSNKCVPLCLEGCSTPDCLSTCHQDYDTIYDYDTIETDNCNGTCLNGTCVAAGVCHCNPGYKRLPGACEPTCSSCEHGSCVAPGKCECGSGYQTNDEQCGSCKPICFGCEHGKCKAPGQCECDPGYKAENAKCEPHCSYCPNGHCVAPDICVCDNGWYMDVDKLECVAHCDVACGNGTCIAPNHCECHAGYSIKSPQAGDEAWYNKAPQCIPECNTCDGLCIAPEVCRCEELYETVYTTLDGSECDCFDCSDDSRKCVRTTCRKSANETDEAAVKGINQTKLFTTQKHLDEITPIGLANTNMTKSLNTSSCMSLNKSTWFMYHWIYIAIIVFELVVIICVLVFMERKHILNRLKTKKFIPQDKSSGEVSVHYSSSVTCSKIKESSEPSL